MYAHVDQACGVRRGLPDRLRLRPVKRYPTGDPLPQDPVGQKLSELFPNGWDWIYAESPETFTRPEWETVKHYPLTPQQLWEYYQDPASLIGIRPKSETRWIVIDIDAHSPHHPRQDMRALGEIQEALESIGICRVQINQSSFTGGLHLYCPLPEAVSSFWLSVAVKYALESIKIPLKSGQCEIFPNPKRYKPRGKGFSNYAAIRLPMQPDSGFVPLDEDLHPQSWSVETWLEEFERLSEHQDMACLTQALVESKVTFKQRKKREPRSVQNWQDSIATEKAVGWTGAGQTNEKLKTFACEARVFLGLDTIDEIAEHVHDTAINSRGFHEYSNHVSDIRRRSLEVASWAYEYYWPYGSDPQRSTTYQSDRKLSDFQYHRELKQKSQEKIKAARVRLESAGHLLPGITERATQLIFEAKVSRKTLYKTHNLELWHPKFDEYQSVEQDVVPPLKTSETPVGQENLPLHSKAEPEAKEKRPDPLSNKESFQLPNNEGFEDHLKPNGATVALPLKGQRAAKVASDVSDSPSITNWEELKASLPPRLQEKITRKQHQLSLQLDSKDSISTNSLSTLPLVSQNFDKDSSECFREPYAFELEEFNYWYGLALSAGFVTDYDWLKCEFFVFTNGKWLPYCELSAMYTVTRLRKILGLE